ncbi:MAG: hypothetical protein HY537_08645 [Deltaproteobacteria bacterium]|nr:hypothetical protein [Deltaproteobacteria bacterium]
MMLHKTIRSVTQPVQILLRRYSNPRNRGGHFYSVKPEILIKLRQVTTASLSTNKTLFWYGKFNGGRSKPNHAISGHSAMRTRLCR